MTDELAQQTTESSGPAAGGGATVTPERSARAPPSRTSPTPRSTSTASSPGSTSTTGCCSWPRTRASRCSSGSTSAAIYEDNLDEFFMVRVAGLHEQVESKIDARGADAMARRRRHRPDPPADDRAARRGSTRCFEDEIQPGARRARDPDHLPRRRERAGARGGRAPLHQPGLPGADAAGDRPRPAVPLHLEHVPEHRGPAPQPREGRGGRGPGQGAEGAAAPLPLDRRRRSPSCRSRR